MWTDYKVSISESVDKYTVSKLCECWKKGEFKQFEVSVEDETRECVQKLQLNTQRGGKKTIPKSLVHTYFVWIFN